MASCKLNISLKPQYGLCASVFKCAFQGAISTGLLCTFIYLVFSAVYILVVSIWLPLLVVPFLADVYIIIK